jgi:hypothetical protein
MGGKHEWRDDKPRLESKIPLTAPFEDCIWYDNSQDGWFPSPDSFIWGYILLADEEIESLQADYEWSPSSFDTKTAKRPRSSTLADEFLKSGPYLESKEFMEQHQKSSPFIAGEIILNPTARIAYFHLCTL